MTSDEAPKGIVIPMWAWGIIGGALLMIGGWTATTLMDVRDQAAILSEKVRVLEASDSTRSTLPLAVARLEAKLDSLSTELAAVREDLRRSRPNEVRR